jgi:molybdenum cofactor cytidylyltransferase
MAVAILAAGKSERMGRPKLLLPWRSGTVLQHLVRNWVELGAKQIGVVWSRNAPEIKAELNRMGEPLALAIENPDLHGEMWSSIQCAARWASWQPDVSHFCLSLGDQPQIRIETLAALVVATGSLESAGIVQPQFQGKRGHPVMFSRDWWNKVAGSDQTTLRDFLNANAAAIRLVELNDPGLAEDMDSPADYQSALKRVCES